MITKNIETFAELDLILLVIENAVANLKPFSMNRESQRLARIQESDEWLARCRLQQICSLVIASAEVRSESSNVMERKLRRFMRSSVTIAPCIALIAELCRIHQSQVRFSLLHDPTHLLDGDTVARQLNTFAEAIDASRSINSLSSYASIIAASYLIPDGSDHAEFHVLQK